MADALLHSNPRTLSPDVYRSCFRGFIETYKIHEVAELYFSACGPEQHFSFEVSYDDLLDYDPSLAFTLVHNPTMLMYLFNEAIFEVQKGIEKNVLVLKHHKGVRGSIKMHAHVRITYLPPTPDVTKEVISDIRAHEVDRLIQVSGTVVRTGGVRMLELSKEYECQNNKCMYRFRVHADPEQNYLLPQPRTCPSSKVQTCHQSELDPNSSNGGNESSKKKSCSSTNLREVEQSRTCVDYQEIKIQDQIERLALGCVPRSIVVVLQADLVDKFNAGDDVIIVGHIVRQWRSVCRGARCIVDHVLHANSVRAMNSNEKIRAQIGEQREKFEAFWDFFHKEKRVFEARDLIVRSVCPQLCGMYLVKLALLLTLVGGSSGDKHNPTVRRRSQSHLLIIGDPGCGKSQLLRFAASMSSRSVITTGVGTTGAGLTCTAVRDGNDWSLEAGALVLANDGICCIDEFASIKEQDRASIHEAMEQQTLSVAKAGLVVKLQTRATVIACCNPKGSYDVTADISTNTAIASPLLSRFDLVLVLIDNPQKDWDRQVSTFLLQSAVTNSIPTDTSIGAATSAATNTTAGCAAGSVAARRQEEVVSALAGLPGGYWDVTTLRNYLSYVKTELQPSLGPEARCLLMRYYQIQRQSDDRSSARTTVRLLESLVRLAEAHARLVCHTNVELCDAVVAVYCINLSQSTDSLLDTASTLQSSFPSLDISEDAYDAMEKKVWTLVSFSKESLLLEVEKGQHSTGTELGTKSVLLTGLVPTQPAVDEDPVLMGTLHTEDDCSFDRAYHGMKPLKNISSLPAIDKMAILPHSSTIGSVGHGSVLSGYPVQQESIDTGGDSLPVLGSDVQRWGDLHSSVNANRKDSYSHEQAQSTWADITYGTQPVQESDAPLQGSWHQDNYVCGGDGGGGSSGSSSSRVVQGAAYVQQSSLQRSRSERSDGQSSFDGLEPRTAFGVQSSRFSDSYHSDADISASSAKLSGGPIVGWSGAEKRKSCYVDSLAAGQHIEQQKASKRASNTTVGVGHHDRTKPDNSTCSVPKDGSAPFLWGLQLKSSDSNGNEVFQMSSRDGLRSDIQKNHLQPQLRDWVNFGNAAAILQTMDVDDEDDSW